MTAPLTGAITGALVLSLALAAPAWAEAPAGWFTGGDGYSVRLDPEVAVAGAGSIRIARVGPGSAGFAMRYVPRADIDGDWVRLSAAVRSEQVEGGYAGLFLRFDRGGEILYLDNMRDRGVTGTTDWTRHEVLARIPDDADRVVFGALLAGNGTAWFDAFFVEELSDERVPEPPDAVVAYLDRALNIMERYALNADRIDWPSFRARVRDSARGAPDVAAAHPVLRNALNALEDRHSRLMAPQEAREWEAGPDDAARPMPHGHPLVGTTVAYLELPRFDGPDPAAITRYADAAQRVLAAHPACAWIIDLRGNSGGNMWPMLAGVGPLLDVESPGAFEGAHGQRAWWWYRDGAAGVGENEGARISGEPVRLGRRPVVGLLTGPTTASSGEALAVAFAGQQDARRFGYETAGLTTGTQQFILSDGAVMWLTTSRYLDRTGRAYGGVLEPDERVVPTGRSRTEDPVLEAAAEWARVRCASVR